VTNGFVTGVVSYQALNALYERYSHGQSLDELTLLADLEESGSKGHMLGRMRVCQHDAHKPRGKWPNLLAASCRRGPHDPT
jgi:hypothetical protein